jgi:hypothetical protein
LLNAFKKLGKKPLSFNEEYSLESLWHEILHNRQTLTQWVGPGDIRHAVMETMNQWVARRTYGEMMTTLGGFSPIHMEAIKAGGHGYRLWVANFDALLGRLKLSDADVLEDLRAMHTGVEGYSYIDPLAKLLATKAGAPEKEALIKSAIRHLRKSSGDFDWWLNSL